MTVSVRPLRDQILVERLEGHGIERTTKGGIILPASLEARARTKSDYFRARVEAVGPDVRELAKDDHVLVYTWADGGSKLYTGVGVGRNRLFVTPEDIVCAVAPDADVEVRQADGR
jgi:co-chaperonin GroES (HSP10)